MNKKGEKWWSMIPQWLPTGLMIAVILWLTLAHKPVGDMNLQLFEGADKAIHAVLFLLLTFIACFDSMRTLRRGVSLTLISAIVFASAIFGVCIEYIQDLMGLGRTFEWLDMVADAFGSVVGGVLWMLYQSLSKSIKDKI